MDSKVAVAVIGAGYWGPNLIRNFYETDKCELKIICDSNNERINMIRGKYPDVNMSVSADCVIENKTIDAVCIATPVNHCSSITDSVATSSSICGENLQLYGVFHSRYYHLKYFLLY